MGAAWSLAGSAKLTPVGSIPTASTRKQGNFTMPDDPQFDKSEFVKVIGNLLNTKPLQKNKIKTSKKTKVRTVIPPNPPKPEK
jgi:hypothetical protein